MSENFSERYFVTGGRTMNGRKSRSLQNCMISRNMVTRFCLPATICAGNGAFISSIPNCCCQPFIHFSASCSSPCVSSFCFMILAGSVRLHKSSSMELSRKGVASIRIFPNNVVKKNLQRFQGAISYNIFPTLCPYSSCSKNYKDLER